MRSHREVRAKVRSSIPKRTGLNTEGVGFGNITFELLKLSKLAENYKRERDRLVKQLKENAQNYKSIKERFDVLKLELETEYGRHFGQNGKKRTKPFLGMKTKAVNQMEKLSKFFEHEY